MLQLRVLSDQRKFTAFEQSSSCSITNALHKQEQEHCATNDKTVSSLEAKDARALDRISSKDANALDSLSSASSTKANLKPQHEANFQNSSLPDPSKGLFWSHADKLAKDPDFPGSLEYQNYLKQQQVQANNQSLKTKPLTDSSQEQEPSAFAFGELCHKQAHTNDFLTEESLKVMQAETAKHKSAPQDQSLDKSKSQQTQSLEDLKAFQEQSLEVLRAHGSASLNKDKVHSNAALGYAAGFVAGFAAGSASAKRSNSNNADQSKKTVLNDTNKQLSEQNLANSSLMSHLELSNQQSDTTTSNAFCHKHISYDEQSILQSTQKHQYGEQDAYIENDLEWTDTSTQLSSCPSMSPQERHRFLNGIQLDYISQIDNAELMQPILVQKEDRSTVHGTYRTVTDNLMERTALGFEQTAKFFSELEHDDAELELSKQQYNEQDTFAKELVSEVKQATFKVKEGLNHPELAAQTASLVVGVSQKKGTTTETLHAKTAYEQLASVDTKHQSAPLARQSTGGTNMNEVKRQELSHPASPWHDHHDFVFDISMDSDAKLTQLMGSWLFDSAHGGVNLDATASSLLGLRNNLGFLSFDKLKEYFIPSDLINLKYCMSSPNVGDLLIGSFILSKGDNFGKRFILQGKVMSRDEKGHAVKAFGTIAYESSPYAEFLTREIANDGMFIWDHHLHTIISNSAFHQLLGFSESEFPKTLSSLMTLIHPDDNDVLSLQGHILSSPQYGDSYECCTRIRRADQKYIWATVRTLVIERDQKGIATKLIAAITNIDMLQENFDSLKLLMFTDPLTGLHNRTYFHQNQLRYEDPNLSPVSIIFIDVSGLKLTNDILGHNYGDFLLLKTSQLIQNALQVTLTEYNADQKIVNMLIANRTALSLQSEMIGSTLNSNENNVSNNNATGIMPKFIGSNTISDAINAQKQNLCVYRTTTDDYGEFSYNTQVSSSFDANVIGHTNRTTNVVTIEANYIPKQHEQVNTSKYEPQGLDCLDRPEGCLLKESDLNSSEKAIINLPSDFLSDLEQLGVTTISMDNENKSTVFTNSTKDELEAAQIGAKAADKIKASEKQNKVKSTDITLDLEVALPQSDDSNSAEISSAVLGSIVDAHRGSPLELNSETLQAAVLEASGRPKRATMQAMKDEINEEAKRKQSHEYSPEILRMGGDEFIILFPNCDENKIKRLYHNILEIRTLVLANQEKVPLEQRSVPICFGIGMSTVGENGMRNDNFLQALQRADYRMQNNKEEHHNENYVLLQAFFEAKLHRNVSMRDERRLHILSQKERNKLRQHIQDYQPK